MAKAGTAGGTPATRVLTEAGVPFTAHEFTAHDRARAEGRGSGAQAGSFGAEAAAALDVPAQLVFKTLVTDVDGQLWVAVLPVPSRLDLKALAAAAGGKRAAMADPRRAERSTGYVVGGISPLGQRTPLPTVVDTSALAHAAVYVSGGRRGLDLAVAPADLVRLTDAVIADVTRAD